jgi:outer membrane biogenesis lipoprotein LolB
MLVRTLLPVMALALLAGCIGGPPTAEADRQVCREHHKDNPTERDRCNLDADVRHGSPPQARPQDLPIRVGDGQGF